MGVVPGMLNAIARSPSMSETGRSRVRRRTPDCEKTTPRGSAGTPASKAEARCLRNPVARHSRSRRLRVRAELLPDAGPRLTAAMIDELRELHLGIARLDPALARPAIPDVRGQRRMQHLYRLHAEGFDAVEDPLAGPEQNRGDVERELVDDPGDQRLPHGPGTPRDVHAVIAGGFARLCVGGVEPAGDEMEARPAVHLDRLASVMGEHEHRSVVRRLRSPPPAPVLVPLTADRPEHVATHQVGAPRTHEPAGRRLVRLVGALVAQVPGVQLPPALAQGVLATLLWPGNESVKRNRHVARGVLHQHPPEWLRPVSGRPP